MHMFLLCKRTALTRSLGGVRWYMFIFTAPSNYTFEIQNSAFLSLTLMQLKDQHSTLFGYAGTLVNHTSYAAEIVRL